MWFQTYVVPVVAGGNIRRRCLAHVTCVCRQLSQSGCYAATGQQQAYNLLPMKHWQVANIRLSLRIPCSGWRFDDLKPTIPSGRTVLHRRLSSSTGSPPKNRESTTEEVNKDVNDKDLHNKDLHDKDLHDKDLHDKDPHAEVLSSPAPEEEGSPRHEEPKHSHIKMPSITDDEKFGTLTKWSVNIGDQVEVGDIVCEIELEQFSVGVTVESKGYIADILVAAGTKMVPVGFELAAVVRSEADIVAYQEAQKPQASSELDVEESKEELPSFSWKDVLKAVLRLNQSGKFSEEEASALMALARSKDTDLMQAFDGCFEGTEFQGHIDDDLFLMQAKDIAKVLRKEAKAHGVDPVEEAEERKQRD